MAVLYCMYCMYVIGAALPPSWVLVGITISWGKVCVGLSELVGVGIGIGVGVGVCVLRAVGIKYIVYEVTCSAQRSSWTRLD